MKYPNPTRSAVLLLPSVNAWHLAIRLIATAAALTGSDSSESAARIIAMRSSSSGSSNHSSLSRIEALNATTYRRSGIFNCRAEKSANLCIAQPFLLTIYGRCRLTVQPILLQPWFRLFETCSNCTPVQ